MQKSLPDPINALFPDAASRAQVSHWLTETLEAAARRVQAGPVTPSIDSQAFLKELAAFNLGSPRPLQEALVWAIEQMEHGIVQMSNPRYFGLFNPGANFPAQCADHIVALFNPQLASSASSPVPVAMESHLIQAIAARAGFGPEATGHFATGGSEANYTALICALTAANPLFARDGVRAYGAPVVFYTSRDCHIAWLKIAHQAGVGRAALRLVDTDGHGRMDINALKRDIAADRAAGSVPVMVGRHRRNHGRRHDRPAGGVRRPRQPRKALVSCRCRLGRCRTRLRDAARFGSQASSAPIP